MRWRRVGRTSTSSIEQVFSGAPDQGRPVAFIALLSTLSKVAERPGRLFQLLERAELWLLSRINRTLAEECYNAATRSESVLAAKDISKLLLGIPRGAWVALSADEERVLAYGTELAEVVKKANELGEADPVVVRVPESSSSLVV